MRGVLLQYALGVALASPDADAAAARQLEAQYLKPLSMQVHGLRLATEVGQNVTREERVGPWSSCIQG